MDPMGGVLALTRTRRLRFSARGSGGGMFRCTASRAMCTSPRGTSGHAFGRRPVSDRPPHSRSALPSTCVSADIDCVFVRKDPPFDAEYLYVTLMLSKSFAGACSWSTIHGAYVDANEKSLHAVHFERHMPRTLVTSDRDRIHRFVAQLGGPAVVKPRSTGPEAAVWMVVSKSDAAEQR